MAMLSLALVISSFPINSAIADPGEHEASDSESYEIVYDSIDEGVDETADPYVDAVSGESEPGQDGEDVAPMEVALQEAAIDPYTDEYLLSGEDVIFSGFDPSQILPVVSSKRYAVMDSAGNLVASKNESEKVKIASVTKIMTAIVADGFDMDMPIIVSEHAASIPGSTAEIMAGDETTLYELLKGLMLPSGNDAAYAIAESCGEKLLERDGADLARRGDVESCIQRFVDEMNWKASEIGLVDSLFANPCGLDDEGFEGDHVSSARDVAQMTKAAYASDAIREISEMSEATLLCDRGGIAYELPLSNTNDLLVMDKGARGMKTGFTDLAGYCLASVFEDADGCTYYISTLGSEQRSPSFSDAIELRNWIHDSKRSYDITEEMDVIDGVVDIGVLGHREWILREIPLVCEVGEAKTISRYAWEDSPAARVRIDARSVAFGDIYSGDVLGTLEISDSCGKVYQSYDIIASEDVAAPNMIEKIQVSAIRFISTILGHEVDHMPDKIILEKRK